MNVSASARPCSTAAARSSSANPSVALPLSRITRLARRAASRCVLARVEVLRVAARDQDHRLLEAAQRRDTRDGRRAGAVVHPCHAVQLAHDLQPVRDATEVRHRAADRLALDADQFRGQRRRLDVAQVVRATQADRVGIGEGRAWSGYARGQATPRSAL